MITNFEELTVDDLTQEEHQATRLIINGLKLRVGKDKAVTSVEMLEGLNQYGIKLSGARLRKLIRFIRMSGFIECVQATSNGYYITTNKPEGKEYIKSLQERADAIYALAKQYEYQLNKKFGKEE